MLTLAVDRRSVTGMLNLGDILKLVNDGLNERALVAQEALAQRHEAIFHLRFEFGEQL